jgi:hypothetical protein
VVYDSAWKENNQNIYQWMIQFSQPTALPVQITKFQVASGNKQALVEWTSSNESESKEYIIERSPDAVNFYEIGRVKAAGQSNQVKEYRFIDMLPLAGNSFYRLSIVSRDGSRQYEGIRKLTNNTAGIHVLVMPVPVKHGMQVMFSIKSAQKILFNISDAQGRKLEAWSANFSAGMVSMPVRTDKLGYGVYYLSIYCNEFTETKKFVKQ